MKLLIQLKLLMLSTADYRKNEAANLAESKMVMTEMMKVLICGQYDMANISVGVCNVETSFTDIVTLILQQQELIVLNIN